MNHSKEEFTNDRIMNNTKWEEIRISMNQNLFNTSWRTKNVETGYISSWDMEWFYHFKDGGYKTIEWLEIMLNNEIDRNEIVNKLRVIHVPGEIVGNIIRIYGYKNGYVEFI